MVKPRIGYIVNGPKTDPRMPHFTKKTGASNQGTPFFSKKRTETVCLRKIKGNAKRKTARDSPAGQEKGKSGKTDYFVKKGKI
jgi:hypothetical protein